MAAMTIGAAFEAARAVLQVEDQAAQGFPAARTIGMGDALLHAGQHGEVDAGAEVLAGAAQDDDAGFRRVASIHAKAQRISATTSPR